ncbi:Crp/Fnr family transcriptional regulator [Aminobacter sp. AP02]|uniref:Crp/Fnr family transcriptional regulator n=1 Tax=Aminobacter sp. AP02 TaxID=2135737 RepID=UPI000D6CAA3D|nr:Crp/Fnr family transcriptional regulator [Aminobacter sp. AP02]PWK73978.1 CRP-like cAMP-binding protein [Aminobacter sp. AP02]
MKATDAANMKDKMPSAARGNDKELLRSHGWLSRTSPAFQNAVLARGSVNVIPAGKVVYEVGDPPGPIMAVVGGYVSLSTVSRDGQPKLSHLLRPGQWFGAAAILAREPRRVRVTAVTALRNDGWRQFVGIIVDNSDVAVGIARDLMIRDSTTRCLAVLLRLTGYRYSDCQREEQPEIELTQEDLAHLANLSRNATGTILRELQKAHLIEISYKRLKLLKPEILVGRVRKHERDHG